MSKETSNEVASTASIVLSNGNPADNGEIAGIVKNELMGFVPDDKIEAVSDRVALVLKPYFDTLMSLAGSALSQSEEGPNG